MMKPGTRRASSFSVCFRKGLTKLFPLGVAAFFVGGWQVSGVNHIESGTRLFITDSGSALNTPGTTQVPDQVGKFKRLKAIGPGRPWFDQTAFASHPGTTLGNLGKNVYSGPGADYFRRSSLPQLRLSRGSQLQFRVDAFNAFNHPTFNNPDTTYTDVNFGSVTSAGQGRSLQLAATVKF